MPADIDVQSWPLERFREYPNNPRLNDHAVAQMAAAIEAFGFRVPVIARSDGELVDGHLRLKAARLLGLESLPVILADDLSDQEVAALRIAVNKMAELAQWDLPKLRAELQGLSLGGFDMPVLGFGTDLAGLLANPSAADPDTLPEPAVAPVVRLGDLWQLGGHRLLCGDATLADNWTALFKRDRAAMVFTDPPYGVSYVGPRGGYVEVMEGDAKRRDDLYRMLVSALDNLASHAVDGAAFYVWHASSTRRDFDEALMAAGLVERGYLIWVKPAHVLGRGDYHWQHEPCFYASKGEGRPAFYGDHSQFSVWRVATVVDHKRVSVTVGNGLVLLNGEGGTLYVQKRAPKGKRLRELRVTGDREVLLASADGGGSGTVWEVALAGEHLHPTQKPVELARRAIENSSRPGEIVADAFLGSGTCLIGAEMTGRRCYGLELDPVYAGVVVERWQRFSGQEAVLAPSGLTYAVVAAERGKVAAPAD